MGGGGGGRGRRRQQRRQHHGSSLLKLDYAGRDFAEEDAEALLQKGELEYEEVDFSGAGLSEAKLQKVLDVCRQCKKLRVLKLFKNTIDDKGAEALADFIAGYPSIEEMHLSHNHFTAEGVRKLVQVGEQARPEDAIPLWLRLEQNDVPNPEKVFDELRQNFSVCRKDLRGCHNKQCERKCKVHLPHFFVQRGSEAAEQGRRPREAEGGKDWARRGGWWDNAGNGSWGNDRDWQRDRYERARSDSRGRWPESARSYHQDQHYYQPQYSSRAEQDRDSRDRQGSLSPGASEGKALPANVAARTLGRLGILGGGQVKRKETELRSRAAVEDRARGGQSPARQRARLAPRALVERRQAEEYAERSDKDRSPSASPSSSANAGLAGSESEEDDDDAASDNDREDADEEDSSPSERPRARDGRRRGGRAGHRRGSRDRRRRSRSRRRGRRHRESRRRHRRDHGHDRRRHRRNRSRSRSRRRKNDKRRDRARDRRKAKSPSPEDSYVYTYEEEYEEESEDRAAASKKAQQMVEQMAAKTGKEENTTKEGKGSNKRESKTDLPLVKKEVTEEKEKSEEAKEKKASKGKQENKEMSKDDKKDDRDRKARPDKANAEAATKPSGVTKVGSSAPVVVKAASSKAAARPTTAPKPIAKREITAELGDDSSYTYAEEEESESEEVLVPASKATGRKIAAAQKSVAKVEL